MCGIVGYTGTKQAAPILLHGLEKLEYRGYDSAGICVFEGGDLKVAKAKGRLQALVDLTDGGAALQILRAYGDTAGHAALETWTPAQAGWSLAASEPMWLNGAPHRPETPAETALAAMEAAQLGLMSEAASYFSPVFPCADVLARAAGYDGCTPLKYPLPDGTPAVGLIRLQGGLLTVIPARCAAVPGGTVGSWQLTGLEIDEGQ